MWERRRERRKREKGDEKGGRRTEKCERRETYLETFKHREKRDRMERPIHICRDTVRGERDRRHTD